MNSRQRSYYLRARRVMALVHNMPALPESVEDWYPVHVEAAKLRLARLENAQDYYAAAGETHDANFLSYSITSVQRRIERAIPLVEARRARMPNVSWPACDASQAGVRVGTIAIAGAGVGRYLFNPNIA